MRVYVLHPHTNFEVLGPYRSKMWHILCVCVSRPVTLTFDLLTVKLVCESHLRWGTFLLNLGTQGLWVLELFAMYATDGRTDRRTYRRTDWRTDKSNAYCPLPYGSEDINSWQTKNYTSSVFYFEFLNYSQTPEKGETVTRSFSKLAARCFQMYHVWRKFNWL